MSIEFAIPSFQRADIIQEKTLTTLRGLHVPVEAITIFVADKSEAKDYRAKLGNEFKIVVGELGIGNQRRFINDYYKVGTRIVSLDDDVALVRKSNNKIELFKEPLLALVEKVFDLCDKNGVKFWSVTNTNNGFFMKHEWVKGLRSTIGALTGEYSKLPQTQSNLPQCEDIEKTFLHYKCFGGILRLNDLAVQQKRMAKGGVIAQAGGKENREKLITEVSELLVNKYPDLVSLKHKGTPEGGLLRVQNITLGRYDSLIER